MKRLEHVGQAQSLPERISDHKALATCLKVQWEDQREVGVLKALDGSPPPHVALSVWQQFLAESWPASSVCLATRLSSESIHVDEEWTVFQQALRETFLVAATRAQQEVSPMLAPPQQQDVEAWHAKALAFVLSKPTRICVPVVAHADRGHRSAADIVGAISAYWQETWQRVA